MSVFSRPFRRITSTPQIRLLAVTHVLEVVCSLRCRRHNHPAAVYEVTDGSITYAACCEDLLDRVDRALRIPA